jgi:MYXO-CTERM domain-containing protein
LSFTVASASGLEGWRNRVEQFLDDGEPWTYAVPILALLALLALGSRRYLRYRLPFEIR